jgi:hypothetical protein
MKLVIALMTIVLESSEKEVGSRRILFSTILAVADTLG